MRIQTNHNKNEQPGAVVSMSVNELNGQEEKSGKAQKRQGSVSFFAGDLIKKESQSLMEQKREQVREQAHKVLMGKFESDMKRDEIMEESQGRLEEAQASLKAAHEQMKEAPEELKGQLKKEMEEAQRIIEEESSNIQGMKQAKLGELYEYSMAKAVNTEKEILREGAKEIVGAGLKEGMEHIDQMYQENVEKAKEAKEKEEEREEILEERREEREELEEMLKPKESVQSQVMKIAEEAGLLEEDVKGIVVDAQT